MDTLESYGYILQPGGQLETPGLVSLGPRLTNPTWPDPGNDNAMECQECRILSTPCQHYGWYAMNRFGQKCRITLIEFRAQPQTSRIELNLIQKF